MSSEPSAPPGDAASTRPRRLRLWTGAVAGAVSAVAFAAVHYVLIADIWDMTGVLAVAGASSGLCLAWSYRRLRGPPSAARWLRYNLTFIGLFAVVPALSLALFEPVMSFAEAANSEGPLDDLIIEALPLTIVAVLAIGAVVSFAYGSLRHDLGPILVTAAVLMVFLGLNLTIIGLVGWSAGMLRIIAGFVGLILVLGMVFALVYLGFEWNRFRSATDAVPRRTIG